jgi:microcystin-dependent protein
MSCPTVTTIQKTECIGNSLVTINSNFASLKDAACDNSQQIQALLNSFVGVVSYFPATTAPAGWLVLNGSVLSRAEYSNLWTFASNSGNITTTDASWFSLSAVGRFSPGNGSTTFRLPDLRGTFVRSFGTLNPSVASGGIGLYQADAFESHTHTGTTNTAGAHTHTACQVYPIGTQAEGGPAGRLGSGATGSAGAHSHTVSLNNTGGTETRPHNIALLPCIKY